MPEPDATTASAAAQHAGAAGAELRPGDRIGSYVLRETLGEGGFAVVFVADQLEPVARKVALKVIKLGMDTRQVIARFEAERQALAMMEHPHVARVYDAGTTAGGRPYFAMEHVPGEAINTYCDRHRLNIQERLSLVIQACDAVQHAHQKGIIHRDLKPSNVLVTVRAGDPQVKVIDFGVAKAIARRLTEHTLYTEQGQLIGTPEYMSPEQAEMTGLDVDTRTDIYSLGVLLYELLAGVLPFDHRRLRWSGLHEIQRVIREEEPDPPSGRFLGLGGDRAKLAGVRRCDARSLPRALRGELDWITMKAIDKDRTRRYPSASELAADVRRYLNSMPVLAGPPSARYWLRKLVNRHKLGAAATSAVVFAMLAGMVFSTTFAVVQMRARADAAAAVAMLYEAQAGREAPDTETMLETVVDILRRTDRDSPALPLALNSLAELYADEQRHEEAEAALGEADRLLQAAAATE